MLLRVAALVTDGVLLADPDEAEAGADAVPVAARVRLVRGEGVAVAVLQQLPAPGLGVPQVPRRAGQCAATLQMATLLL